MAEPRIDVDGLPLGVSGPFDTVVGVDEATGAARRFPMPQAGAPRSYASRGALPAASGFSEGYTVWVNNDPVPANNGTWAVLGGFWIQSADRVTGLEGRVGATELELEPLAESHSFEWAPGAAFAIADEAGRAALAVLADGTVQAHTVGVAVMQADVVNGIPASSLANAVAATDTFDLAPAVGVAWAVADTGGRAPLAVLDDGTVVISDVNVANINGAPASAYTVQPDYSGDFAGEMTYFNSAGQSLGEGSNGALTTTQEYDNIGFPARASSPTTTVALTVANTQYATRGESPMYGALGHIKELIEQEAGIAYTGQNYQLLACNNSYGGQGIASLSKGRPEYAAVISQVQAGYNIAQAANKTFMAGATFWTQGESDTTLTLADYRDRLTLLATNYDTDMRAITGQARPVPLICYQTGTMATRTVALAQLAAADDSPLVHMACPMYQFAYYDSQHITAESSKWLGAYYGLVYKRIVIDGKDWTPVRPLSHIRQGAAVNVKFATPVRPLVLDTTLVPAQANHGFSLVDSGGAAMVISSVSLIGPDTIKVVASAPIPDGAKLRYGFNSAVGKGAYTGGCGNLRDSQGAKVVYDKINKPMHNWAVIFEYAL